MDPYDMGWQHGAEDIGFRFKYRPDEPLTPEQFEEYKQGYRDARRGWDE